MNLLYSCQAVSKSIGTRNLFKDLTLSIFSGDHLGLIGPNGSGKTTLLKIIAGLESPDVGTLAPRKGLRIGYVPQTCEFPDKSPLEVLVDAQPSGPDYEKERHAETWLSKFGFRQSDRSAALLSGGWKKRLALARELISSPDLLLLDEPTNHLDLEGIVWLEKFLAREATTYILVSHDRYFLQNATNRVVEINKAYPRGMFAIDGPYSQFLAQKQLFLEGQLQQERSIASKARKETEWLRQSPKARTTKAQSRIDDAHDTLKELSDVHKRNRQHKADIDFEGTERQTRKLLTGKNLSKTLGDRLLFRNLDLTLSPGSRIGLMGPNGCGKTTLLRLLANELAPDQGTLKRADALKVVYFDQHRARLPDTLSLRQALSPNGDFVNFRGQPIHVNGWCQRFLFSPDVLDMPIGKLSGGERARISVAHLMLQPADLLLLDEPTNDLDIPTLEMLENGLIDFPGAVVLITHDRCMLDRICNSVLALGDPDKTEFYADYAQWQTTQAPIKNVSEPTREKKKELSAAPKTKLSYTEKREYEQLEGKIAKLEEEVKQLNKLLCDPVIAGDGQRLHDLCAAVGLAENQIEQLYLRWEELSKKNTA